MTQIAREERLSMHGPDVANHLLPVPDQGGDLAELRRVLLGNISQHADLLLHDVQIGLGLQPVLEHGPVTVQGLATEDYALIGFGGFMDPTLSQKPNAGDKMRFHVQPRCVPPSVAARRIGVSEARFREIAEDLREHGFPLPDPVTGNYDLEAIDRYIDKRNAALLAKGGDPDGAETDNDVFMARIAAMGGG